MGELPLSERENCVDDVNVCLVSDWHADQILREDSQECTQSDYSSVRARKPITLTDISVSVKGLRNLKRHS